MVFALTVVLLAACSTKEMDFQTSAFNKNTYNQQYQFTGETGDNAGGFRKVDTDEFVTGQEIGERAFFLAKGHIKSKSRQPLLHSEPPICSTIPIAGYGIDTSLGSLSTFRCRGFSVCPVCAE